MKLQKPASTYNLDDIDTNGTLFVKPVNPSSISVSDKFYREKPLSTSFRLHVSGEERDRFKALCRSRGSNMCWVLSGFIRACLAKDDCVLNANGVTIVNQFYGKPRGPTDKIASAVLPRKTTVGASEEPKAMNERT